MILPAATANGTECPAAPSPACTPDLQAVSVHRQSTVWLVSPRLRHVRFIQYLQVSFLIHQLVA